MPAIARRGARPVGPSRVRSARVRSVAARVAVVLAFPSSFANAGDAEVDWAGVRERVGPCVVTVEVFDASGTTDQGSGFFVTRDGVLATSRHLFRRATRARIVRDDGTVHDAAGVRAVDSRNDLVLLAVPVDDAPTLEWGETTSLAPGTPVAMLGSAKGVAGTFATGAYVGRKDALGVLGFVETTAPMEHGASGNPLFDAKGRLLGLGAARVDWAQPSGLSISVERLKKLVDTLSTSSEVRPFGTAATFLDASEWAVQRSKEMAVATRAAAAGDDAGLVDGMRAVVKAYPESALARYGLAGALSLGDRHAEAVASLREAVALDPGYFEAWGALGDAASRVGDHASAASAFRKATAIEPRDLSSWFRLGASLVQAGDPQGAIGVLEPVTSRADRPDVWAWLGTAYARTGRVEDARRVVERLRPAHPDAADGLLREIERAKR